MFVCGCSDLHCYSILLVKILSNIDIQEEGNWQEEIRLGLKDLIFDHALKNYAEKASSWKTIPLCSKFLNSSKLAQPGLRTIASPVKDNKIHISRHQQTRMTNWFAVVSTSCMVNGILLHICDRKAGKAKTIIYQCLPNQHSWISKLGEIHYRCISLFSCN